MSNDATYTGFEFDVDGFPAVAIINRDLKDAKLQQRYHTAVFVELVPDATTELGHPAEAEYDYLVDAEKKMIDYLQAQTETVHVGHVTLYRLLQVIFYSREPEKVQTFLDHFLSTLGRSHTVEMEPDAEWENVSAFYDLL